MSCGGSTIGDDIEDLTPKVEFFDTNAQPSRSQISINKFQNKERLDENDSKQRAFHNEFSNLNGGIPGSQQVYVKTWGCSHNWSDSEYMAGLLKQAGYRVTFNESESLLSDIWVLNSCTVKGRAQNLFESALKKARQYNKYIVAAGCVPSGDKNNDLWKNDVSLIGVQQIDNIVYAVKETVKGNIVQILGNKKTLDDGDEHNHDNDVDSENKSNEIKEREREKEKDSEADKGSKNFKDARIVDSNSLTNSYMTSLKRKRKMDVKTVLRQRKAGGAPLSMPKLRRNELEEIIPINTGCLNQCTYCKTKHARGDLGSYTIEEIISRIKEVITQDNIRIINLESEDTGAYGLDIGTNIAELLETIEKEVLNDAKYNRNIMLRLGISNPPYFLEYAERVANVLKNEKVFCYMHIPVQSGSNQVLYDMRRKYTIDEFNQLCNIMKNKLGDNIHLCTDIIAGFPTETEEDWKKTVDIVEQWKFQTIFISPFFPRPGTPAARMEYVFGNGSEVEISKIKKGRVRELTNLVKTFNCFVNHKNTRQFWICISNVTKDGIHFVGLNNFAEKICVACPKELSNLYGKDTDSNSILKGKILEVDVFDCGQKYMYAKIGKDYIDLMLQYPFETNYVELKRELENLDKGDDCGDDNKTVKGKKTNRIIGNSTNFLWLIAFGIVLILSVVFNKLR